MRALSLLVAIPAFALTTMTSRAEPPTLSAPAATPPAASSAAATDATPARPTEMKVTPAAATPSRPAQPATTLVTRIDLSAQRMEVRYDGKVQHTWAISSGAEGYATPRGTFRPQWTAKMWYSRKYDNSPMPHSVFFSGGVAVHATRYTGMLGQPASHGCVRLAPANAATYYALVHKHGLKQTRIEVFGTPPPTRVARRQPAGQPVRQAAWTTPGSYQSGSAFGWGWSQPAYQQPPRAALRQPLVRPGGNGIVYLPKGSPMQGRSSFVLNGVTYVRVR